MNRKAVGKAMMLVGGAGAAAQLGGVNPFVSGGLPANHDDWMAVLAQILMAVVGAILNGKGAGK